MAKSELLPRPGDSERLLAGGLHIGSIFSPIVLPAIVFFATRPNRGFVHAHARQSLVESLVLKGLLLVAFLCSASYTAYRLWTYYQNDWQNFDLREFFVRFVIGWAALLLLETINFIVSVRQAVRAFDGRWPRRDERALERD